MLYMPCCAYCFNKRTPIIALACGLSFKDGRRSCSHPRYDMDSRWEKKREKCHLRDKCFTSVSLAIWVKTMSLGSPWNNTKKPRAERAGHYKRAEEILFQICLSRSGNTQFLIARRKERWTCCSAPYTISWMLTNEKGRSQ